MWRSCQLSLNFGGTKWYPRGTKQIAAAANENAPDASGRGHSVCSPRDRLHLIPETWLTQLAFGESLASPDAEENV